MGIDDRDYDYRARGQSPRRRGSYEDGEPPASRSYQRGRPQGYDESSSRGSGRRDYGRESDPRSSSGSRNDRSGYDRRPRPDQSGSSGSGRRSRGDWEDDPSMRRERRGPDPYSYGDPSARPRGAPRGPSPADSGGRHRRAGAAVAPTRGGLWGDQSLQATGMRRGMMDARDPRAARRGLAQVEEEESSGAAAFGKALMAMVLALVIGAGAAYGYYIYSTPKLPAGMVSPTASPTASPSASPSTSPSTTPTSGSKGSSVSGQSVVLVTAGPSARAS